MIFDIERINEEGLNFDTLESKKRFKIESPDCSLKEDVKIQGKLKKTGGGILCTGILKTELSVTCSRCLSNFSFVVKGQLKVHFNPKVESSTLAHEIELTELDVEQEFYEGDQIDLSNAARDLILLSLPQIVLCQKDCAGLCPDCGINLNENKCYCKKEGSFDPRLAVLKQIKDKLK